MPHVLNAARIENIIRIINPQVNIPSVGVVKTRGYQISPVVQKYHIGYVGQGLVLVIYATPEIFPACSALIDVH